MGGYDAVIDSMGQRDPDFRCMPLEQGLDSQLVAGIGDRPQKADRYRFDTFRDQPLRHFLHPGFVQVAHDCAIGIDTLGNLECERPLDERLGVGDAVVEERQTESSRIAPPIGW